MSENIRQQAVINALAMQREEASNKFVYAAGEIAILKAEIEELKAELEELKEPKDAK